MKTRAIAAFLSLTFAIGWLFQGLAIVYGLQASGRIWLVAAMWSPAFAALLTRESRAQVWLRLKRGGSRYWIVALVAGWSFSILSELFLWMTRAGHWNCGTFVLSADHSRIESIHHVAMLLGVGTQSFPWFAVNLILTVSVASVISVVMTIGEEAGWRGFLQGALSQRFGWFKGTLIVGLIWGYWHLPVNLAGYNDARHPILQALLIFEVHTVAMSFVLACLVKWSGSLWPAALAHSANNTLQSGPLIVSSGWSGDQLTAVVASSLIGTAAAAALRPKILVSSLVGDPR